jgi:hypothetical protein
MAASGISLADANVWLALAVEAHIHHGAAKTWFDAQTEDSTAFCRITQLALLRHLTNARILGADVQTQAQAWKTYEALADDPRVIFSMKQSISPLHSSPSRWETFPATSAGRTPISRPSQNRRGWRSSLSIRDFAVSLPYESGS